jgi:hypothetical protein
MFRCSCAFIQRPCFSERIANSVIPVLYCKMEVSAKKVEMLDFNQFVNSGKCICFKDFEGLAACNIEKKDLEMAYDDYKKIAYTVYKNSFNKHDTGSICT